MTPTEASGEPERGAGSQERLADYRDKRDFEATSEPSGATTTDGADRPRFVLHQHDATRLHWDLRLEHDGVLLSFALPRFVPWHPDRNHLAVHTEDHPLEYLTFEGTIPEGSYGAGDMFVFDTGDYEPVKIEDTKLVVELHGQRLRGRYALFEFEGRDWLIHRMDPPEDPDRRPPPVPLSPMRAVAGKAPSGRDRAWEVGWPGLRVLITAEAGDVRIHDAEGDECSDRFPELRRIGRATGSIEVVLDGVVVDDGSGALAARLGATPSSVRRLASQRPLRAALFDAIWQDGYPCWDEPWSDRRDRLETLALEADAWFTPTATVGSGKQLLEAAAGRGIPRLIAKKTASRYRCGSASRDWTAVDVGSGRNAGP